MAAQMQPTNSASKAVAMTRINRRSLSILVLSPFSACVDYPTRPIHLIAGFTPGHSGAIILFVALHPSAAEAAGQGAHDRRDLD